MQAILRKFLLSCVRGGEVDSWMGGGGGGGGGGVRNIFFIACFIGSHGSLCLPPFIKGVSAHKSQLGCKGFKT